MRLPLRLALLVTGFVLVPATGWAAEPRAGTQAPASRSGYERIRPLGGPDSVNSALRRHDRPAEAFYRGHVIENAAAPYYRFKSRLKERWGFAFGLDYNVLWEGASASLGARTSAGGVFRFYTHWTVVGRGSPTTGEIVFRLENRHKYGTATSPGNFHKEIGALLSTANSFSDWNWGVTNLQWQQWFAKGRYGIAVGQVDLRDWVDAFDLSNWRTALLGAAVTYPTNPLPAAGLGAGGFAYFRERCTPFLLAGFSDANGHADFKTFETFFDDQEFYAYAQAGWTPSFAERNEKNLHLTYWHQDARTEAGTPEGWGLSFSANWRFDEKWSPFLRGGIAEGGTIASRAGLAAGLGIHRRSHDLFGVAVGWAAPYDESLRDQFTIETFYRLQISQNLGITPDLQVIVQPSNNPDEDVIFLFGLRTQLVF